MIAATMWWYSKKKNDDLVDAVVYAVDRFVEKHGYDPTIVVLPIGEKGNGNGLIKSLKTNGITIQVGYKERNIPPQHFYLYPVVSKRYPKLDMKRRPVRL